ncbi:MAG TPA: FkbM family methyltransferase [Candidatus Acidoferrum sp.]|nr:FkbM family methyltransferase [Candidatus Acidoferrum sp.]
MAPLPSSKTTRDFIRSPRKKLADIKDALSFRDTFTEVFIEETYLWLAREIRPNTTVVDIGAFIGDSALYFARFPNVKRVLAYEPYPRNYALAKRYIGMSPLRKKIRISNLGVTHDGISRDISRSNNFQSFLLNERKGASDRNVVRSITLSKILHGLKNVAIKCDCEGGERHLFKGVDMREVYAIELEYHGRDDLKGVLEGLKGKGFAIRRADHEDGMGGGILMAKRKG